jgi:two-component system cell cycle sensor histidine kinase/response regulator CckA
MSGRNADLQRSFDFQPLSEPEDGRAGILVVEDDLDLRDLMKASLEMDGFDVITAANGLEGLRRYKENRHRIRIVVTDLDMPTMNGSDMIRHILKMTPSVKVLVASGRSQLERSSPMPCLQKPYTSHDLRLAVEQLRSPSA